MDKQELINTLEQAWQEGPDTNYKYEYNLSILVGRNFNVSLADEANKILEEYLSQGDEKKKRIAYSAFYCLVIFYRHQFNNKALDNLWEKYAKCFSNVNDSSFFKDFGNFYKLDNYRSLWHLEVLRFLDNLNLHNDDFNKDLEYLNLAKQNINIDEYSLKNAGYYHALASLYISIYEKHEGQPDFLEKLKNSEWHKTALEAVNKAIELNSDAAVFHCTRGRILSIQEKKAEAEEEINTAIFMEDPKRHDYSLRIGKYQYYKLLNQIRKQVHNVQAGIAEVNDKINGIKVEIKEVGGENKDIKSEVEKAKDDIRKSRVSSVEIIGIFSGVVSFIIGSLTIANKFSAIEAGFLILTLMGCLTGALSVFSLILNIGYDEKEVVRKENKKRFHYIIIIVCSLILAIGSIFAMKYSSSDSGTNNTSQNTSMEDYNASSNI